MRRFSEVAMRRARLAATCMLPLAVLAAACNAKAVSQQVGEFQRSVTAANAAIASYYDGLNEQELDLYFQLLALDPQMSAGDQIAFTTPAGRLTMASPLAKPPFDPQVIRDRIAVLHHLTAYSLGLAELAGANSPSAFQANMQTLKGKFEDLEQHFARLKQARAEEYAGALQQIVGVVGKWYLNARRWDAVRSAVLDGEKPVNALLDFVATDLQQVEMVVETGAEDKYSTAIVYYNLCRTKASDAARSATLEQIRRYKQAWDAARTVKPDSVVRRLKLTHGELVRVAREDRSNVSIAALKTQLDLYRDDVETLGKAASVIAGLK